MDEAYQLKDRLLTEIFKTSRSIFIISKYKILRCGRIRSKGME